METYNNTILLRVLKLTPPTTEQEIKKRITLNGKKFTEAVKV